MVTQIDSDLFKAPVDIVAHSCSCQCVMGSGIALTIKNLFPEVWQADQRTKPADRSKLGTCQVIPLNKPKGRLKYIANLYGQFDYSRKNLKTTPHAIERMTSYDALDTALTSLREWVYSFYQEEDFPVLGVPWKIGSDCGGGDWNVVESIIYSVFEESPIKVIICKKL